MADVLTRRAIEIWERLEAEVERLKGVLREYEGEAETLRRIEGEQAAEIAALREALAKADFWLGAIPEPLDERVQMARLYLSAALASPDGTTEGE